MAGLEYWEAVGCSKVPFFLASRWIFGIYCRFCFSATMFKARHKVYHTIYFVQRNLHMYDIHPGPHHRDLVGYYKLPYLKSFFIIKGVTIIL